MSITNHNHTQQTRAERVDKMGELHSSLLELWQQLGNDTNDLPFAAAPQHLIRRYSCAAFDMSSIGSQVAMDDLSLARIDKYQQLIEQATEEKVLSLSLSRSEYVCMSVLTPCCDQ
jgi:hypothetical protein